MNIQSIGESAGIVWRLLHGDNRKWEYQELKKTTGLRDRDLNAAIGWLVKEKSNLKNKPIIIHIQLYILN